LGQPISEEFPLTYFYIETQYGPKGRPVRSWWNATLETFGARAFATPIKDDEVFGEFRFIRNDILTAPRYQGVDLRFMSEEDFQQKSGAN
jgi:hypothetical protein